VESPHLMAAGHLRAWAAVFGAIVAGWLRRVMPSKHLPTLICHIGSGHHGQVIERGLYSNKGL
jgi:hypothetical protein